MKNLLQSGAMRGQLWQRRGLALESLSTVLGPGQAGLQGSEAGERGALCDESSLLGADCLPERVRRGRVFLAELASGGAATAGLERTGRVVCDVGGVRVSGSGAYPVEGAGSKG